MRDGPVCMQNALHSRACENSPGQHSAAQPRVPAIAHVGDSALLPSASALLQNPCTFAPPMQCLLQLREGDPQLGWVSPTCSSLQPALVNCLVHLFFLCILGYLPDEEGLIVVTESSQALSGRLSHRRPACSTAYNADCNQMCDI